MKANSHTNKHKRKHLYDIEKYMKMTFTAERIKENELNKTQLSVFDVHLGS